MSNYIAYASRPSNHRPDSVPTHICFYRIKYLQIIGLQIIGLQIIGLQIIGLQIIGLQIIDLQIIDLTVCQHIYACTGITTAP
jgi:hypothetical protein